MSDKYTITVDRKQLESLKMAANIVSRIQMGQLDVLQELVPELSFSEAQSLKKKWFSDLHDDGAYYGIRDPRIDDSARQLYELYAQIMHFLATDEDPEGRWHVYRQPPMQVAAQCKELPQIKKVGS